MQRTAILCPGQGVQLAGMGADVAQASPRAAEVFARASRVLGFDLAEICFHAPAVELERTDLQQPAILVTSLAIWEALSEQSGGPVPFAAVAGLSLGEYTALCLAGCLTLEDAVRLVHRRGQLMQEAALARPGGMVSLIGADEAQAEQVCMQAAQGEVLVTANFNCPGQVVISGSREACARAVGVAESVGCRAIPLKVAGAFHSPLMKSAADGLAEVLAGVQFAAPAVPVCSNVTGEYHGHPETVRRMLGEQVVRPVRWQQCVQRLMADGVTRFIELGPNRVLTGLLRKIDRKAQVVTVSTLQDMHALDSAVAVG